jgi:hypothetical protein
MLKAAGSKKDMKKDFKKKSRVSQNLNSAPNQRALKFASNESIAWLADEQPKKKAKIQKLKDNAKKSSYRSIHRIAI